MNKIRIWKAIGRGVLLESVRRKDLWVIAILGMIIILAASMLGFFGVRGLEVFVKDLAVTVLGIFSTIVAILTSSRLLPDEIRNRTLYPLLARPITRMDLLLGKFFGAVAATWIGFLMLAALTAVALLIFHVQFEWVMIQYMVLKMMGLVVLCAVTLTLSAYMTPQAAATMSFVLAFGSVMFEQGLLMAGNSAGKGMRPIFATVSDILPQYHLFDEGSRAANIGWGSAPIWVVLALGTYMIFYSGAMISMAWSKFRKQAI
ncbi:MAG TPA: ABC transporter permease [Fimbriimonadaceae bacterium]|jgi:ABC-type transport system involved in multi-copper enzyme maturation permease subunit